MKGYSTSGLDLENLLVGLAWMGEASTTHICHLWLPTYHKSAVRKTLQQLQADAYLERRWWYLPRQVRADGSLSGTRRQDGLWSLAKKGRELVRELDTYPPASLAPRHKKLLPHDVETYALIVRMIELARAIGLSGVYLEREVKLDPPRRRPIMDALISFRFGGEPAPAHVVPWTRDPKDATERRRRYAVENDRGSEAVSVIMGKADAYIQAGTPRWLEKYSKPFPLPVWLTPDERRLRVILNAWARVWPSGRWLMTTDDWMEANRWVYYKRGEVTERPLYLTEEAIPTEHDR